jgi:ribose/xylose/arabinose/galactoside ABC-type transport system permease subunit
LFFAGLPSSFRTINVKGLGNLVSRLLDGYLIIVGRAKKLIVSLNTLSAIDGCYLMIVSSLHEGKPEDEA